MSALDTIFRRGQAAEPTNNTVAAQERYPLWGPYLDQKIGELEALVGAGGHGDAPSADPAAGTSLGDPKPLNMAAFELVED